MKNMKFQNILLLFVILSFTSCNNWLDVNPRQEIKESEIYKTEEGAKSVLIGSLLQMGEQSLYGKNTSMYFPEMLVHHWTLKSSAGSTDYAITNYDYTESGTENLIESIWNKYYNVIAHLNNLLFEFDKNSNQVIYNNSNLIKGEALGMRAFLHFDLLRYFGPVPENAKPGDKVIPYVTIMTKDPNQLVSKTWSEVVNLIEKDLNDAELLLKDSDPIVDDNITYEDEWYSAYRENRFNYYAVLATKARFYQWIDDKVNATKYAKLVVDAQKEDGSSVFNLADDNSFIGLNANLIMQCEIIFGIYNSKHQSIVNTLYATQNSLLTQTKENIDIAYEAAQHPNDIRNNKYWEEKTYLSSGTINHYFKYTGNNNDIAPSNVIPLIRLSEMYFILIENLDYTKAIALFDDFRISRNMSSFINDELVNKDKLLEQLEKEYRKEFFAEGQMFFYNKRNNIKTLTWPKSVVLPENAYVIPIPKNQMSFE